MAESAEQTGAVDRLRVAPELGTFAAAQEQRRTEELPTPSSQPRPEKSGSPAHGTPFDKADSNDGSTEEAAKSIEPIPYPVTPVEVTKPLPQPYLGARVVKNGLGSITVVRVSDGSPAKDAGLRIGDAITRVNQTRVDSFQALMQVLLKKKPGETVELGLRRSSEAQTLKVELGSR